MGKIEFGPETEMGLRVAIVRGSGFRKKWEKDCKGDLAILVGESLFSGFRPSFCFVRMGSSNAVWEERGVCAQSCPTLL